MWRATVIERLGPGRVVLTIPALYRDSPVGPMPSAVDAQVEDEVVVADLTPTAKTRSWWVLGFASTIGRWGNAYPHTHPIGQVEGLTDALAAKADDTDLADYTTTTDLTTTLAGYVTDAELTTTLAGYATDTELSTGLAGKANTPGPWTLCNISSYLVADTAAGYPTIQVRTTPLGMQIKGRVRTTTTTRDATIFTLPAGYAPDYPTYLNVPTMGPGTAYAALSYQVELHPTGIATARQDYASGAWMNFNAIVSTTF